MAVAQIGEDGRFVILRFTKINFFARSIYNHKLPCYTELSIDAYKCKLQVERISTMNAITCASESVSRRDFLKTTALTASGLVLAGVGLIVNPGLSLAEEVDTSTLPFAGMTLAQFEEAMNPEHYAGLTEEVKRELSEYYMYETPSGNDQLARADTGGSVSFSDVSSGYQQIAFTSVYRPAVSCSSLFMRVTLSHSSGYYESREFSGAGSELWGSGTFYNLTRSGTYTLVATAYAPAPPAGWSSSPRQSIRYISK